MPIFRQPGKALVAILRSLPSLGALLLVMAGAELGLRSDWAYENLPVPRAYYTYDVTRRVHYLNALQRDHGRLDALFIGSSVVRSDIRPRIVDRRLEERSGGKKFVTFNVGLSKMFPTGAVLYLERLWLERAHPRLVVHGVREVELASRQSKPYYLKHGRIESLWLEDTWLSNLEADLIRDLALLQQQGILQRSIARLSQGEALHQYEKGEIVANVRGFRAERGKVQSARKRKSRRLWRYRKAPKPDRYERQLAAIDRMHALCEARGIQYVLLHLPEHPERFKTKHGPAIWADYKQRVRALAAERGIPFIDATNGDLHMFANDKYYADYHHMRPAGASRFSIKVADQLLKLLD